MSKPETQFYLTIGEAPTDKVSLLNIWIGGILSDERLWFFPASAAQRQTFAWHQVERYDTLCARADEYLARKITEQPTSQVRELSHAALANVQLELPFEEQGRRVAA